MDGHTDDIDAPQTEKTESFDAMSKQEAMRRFKSLDKSVGQILSLLAKPSQPSTASIQGTSTTPASTVSSSPGTSSLPSTSRSGHQEDQVHLASAPAFLKLSSDVTAPSLSAQKVMSSLPAQSVLSEVSAGSSKSDQKSGLAAGDPPQPSVPAESVSTAMPPVPGYLVGKIAKNEFVDFVLLRPCNVRKLPDLEPSSGQLAKLFKVDLLPIETFSDWAEAWAVFAGVIVRKVPERMSKLVGYFLLISVASRDFGGSGWQEYDRAFREHAAENPDVDWGRSCLASGSLRFCHKVPRRLKSRLHFRQPNPPLNAFDGMMVLAPSLAVSMHITALFAKGPIGR